MRKHTIFKATLIVAGAGAVIGATAVSADAATVRPQVHVQEQVYHGPSEYWCEVTVANAEAQYGAVDGFCAYDGFNWNGYINLD